MSQKKITKLTPEQEALIPVYHEKWRKIALSTERIDREKATHAVKEAFGLFGSYQPEILFCDGVNTALNIILDSPYIEQISEGHNLARIFYHELSGHLVNILPNKISISLIKKLIINLKEELKKKISIEVDNQVCHKLDNHGIDYYSWEPYDHIIIEPEVWACDGSYLDFCFSVLNCTYPQRKWNIFESLVKNCGWIFPFENICIVCDRPSKISFDNQNRLHAEAEPAIQFTDGYSLYAYHGVTLPEKYGKLHPQEWQAKWLLEQNNAELRRVLIQGIGYTRIIQQLKAAELDSYQEYTLLKIDNNIDIEPIYLLKMTCPSTGFIHVLRVPPDVKSAREAIRWVNWGINPDEFAVQT